MKCLLDIHVTLSSVRWDICFWNSGSKGNENRQCGQVAILYRGFREDLSRKAAFKKRFKEKR